MDIFATRKGEGIAHGDTGTFTGDGTIAVIHLGYAPKHFILVNTTDVVRFEKVLGMGAANILKQIANGTLTYDTTSLIVLDGKLATIAASVNITGKNFVWLAAC